MAHILIAGLGDLGSSLANALLEESHHISGIRRSRQATAGVDIYPQDLTDDTIFLPPDQIDLLYIILAPPERSVEGYQSTFLTAPTKLLDAIAKRQPLPPLIFVSSTAVYGDISGHIDEDTPPRPNKFNGRILLAAEEELSTRTLTSVIRFSGIYGPGRLRLLKQVDAIAGGKNSPAPSWTNRIHRDDCVDLLKLLGKRWLNGEMGAPLVIGTDNEPSLNTQVLNWLATQQDKTLSLPEPDIAPGKRIQSRFLREENITLRYPDFRAGYTSLLRTQEYNA